MYVRHIPHIVLGSCVLALVSTKMLISLFCRCRLTLLPPVPRRFSGLSLKMISSLWLRFRGIDLGTPDHLNKALISAQRRGLPTPPTFPPACGGPLSPLPAGRVPAAIAALPALARPPPLPQSRWDKKNKNKNKKTKTKTKTTTTKRQAIEDPVTMQQNQELCLQPMGTDKGVSETVKGRGGIEAAAVVTEVGSPAI